MHRGCSSPSCTSCPVSSSPPNCETVSGTSLCGRSSNERPKSLTCSSSCPSQCATSCHTTCFTSARKSPLEHRRMGPRKTKIRSGANFCRKSCCSVLRIPLYKPNISLLGGQFLFSRPSRSTSAGGSSTICMPGKSGNCLIFWGSVLYAHLTISSNVCESVLSGICWAAPCRNSAGCYSIDKSRLHSSTQFTAKTKQACAIARGVLRPDEVNHLLMIQEVGRSRA